MALQRREVQGLGQCQSRALLSPRMSFLWLVCAGLLTVLALALSTFLHPLSMDMDSARPSTPSHTSPSPGVAVVLFKIPRSGSTWVTELLNK